MENFEKFSWKKRALSFKYAYCGICSLIKYEHNARIHLAATILVLLMGFVCHVNSSEWIALILCIGGVWALEAVNSAIEALADHISPQFAPLIKRAKDYSAAGVLLFVIAAVIVGCIVFIPKLF